MKRAGLLLLVAAVLGILWIANRGGRASGSGGAPRSAERRSSDPGQLALDARKEPEASAREPESGALPTEASEASTSISIRSSAGLPLAFAEIQEGDEPWKRRDMNEGRCELGGVALPCRLRAPGHAPASVERLGGEIVLEPDALLVLEAPGLRACAQGIEPFRGWVGPKGERGAETEEQLARLASFGFSDDDRWSIAVTSKLLAAWRPDRKLAVSLERHDRRRIEILFDALPGARASWSPPCADQLDVAPLDLTLDWPEGGIAGEVELRLWVMRQSATGVDTRSVLPWGSVAIGALSSAFLQTRSKPDSDTVALGPWPKGATYGLTASDHASGAYGGMVFEHDGSPRTLSMHPGFAILGRISVPDGVASPTRARMLWEYRTTDRGRSVWRGALQVGPFGIGEQFEAHLVQQVPIERTVDLEPPSILDLKVDAPGFETFHKTYSTGGTRRFDCGVVELKPLVPQLVLAPGSHIDERSIEWRQLRVDARPDVSWTIRSARRQLDESLAIFLFRNTDAEPGEDRFRFSSDRTGDDDWGDFPENPGGFALIESGSEGVCLRRLADGRYESVATIRCTLDVECRSMPTGGGPWIVGWQWQGLSFAASRITPEFEGERTHVELSIPEDGVTLWWSGNEFPPDAKPGKPGEGGTLAATGSLVHVTLP